MRRREEEDIPEVNRKLTQYNVVPPIKQTVCTSTAELPPQNKRKPESNSNMEIDPKKKIVRPVISRLGQGIKTNTMY